MRNRKTAIFASIPVFLYGVLGSFVSYFYFPLASQRSLISVTIALSAITLGFAIHWVVTKLPDSGLCRLTLVAITLALLLNPLFSLFLQTVTYSRFGLTVYGVTPLPCVDIVVDRHGALWFRSKTHLVTADELEQIVETETEVIVIAIGWDNVAVVDEKVFLQFGDVEIHVLATPDAFDLYNDLVQRGKQVALLAHTTC